MLEQRQDVSHAASRYRAEQGRHGGPVMEVKKVAARNGGAFEVPAVTSKPSSPIGWVLPAECARDARGANQTTGCGALTRALVAAGFKLRHTCVTILFNFVPAPTLTLVIPISARANNDT
ncbi:hypothetical protein E4U31_007074 [Claviceps sp. LM219 group G6]|nr:hypothetical protein E4U31_007074 [Claviceps sp. LM219 group G6]